MVMLRYTLYYIEFPIKNEMIRCKVKAHSEDAVYAKLSREFNLPRFEVQIQNIGSYVEDLDNND